MELKQIEAAYEVLANTAGRTSAQSVEMYRLAAVIRVAYRARPMTATAQRSMSAGEFMAGW